MGNLFISNFKRSKIDRDEYLTNVIKYIHLNPVKTWSCQECLAMEI